MLALCSFVGHKCANNKKLHNTLPRISKLKTKMTWISVYISINEWYFQLISCLPYGWIQVNFQNMKEIEVNRMIVWAVSKNMIILIGNNKSIGYYELNAVKTESFKKYNICELLFYWIAIIFEMLRNFRKLRYW